MAEVEVLRVTVCHKLVVFVGEGEVRSYYGAVNRVSEEKRREAAAGYNVPAIGTVG